MNETKLKKYEKDIKDAIAAAAINLENGLIFTKIKKIKILEDVTLSSGIRHSITLFQTRHRLAHATHLKK